MKITFVLPTIERLGGTRVIFEHANQLKKRGHEVSIVYPLIPLIITPEFKVITLIQQVLGLFAVLAKRRTLRWFDLKAKLIIIPTLSPKFIYLFEKKIPNADVVIAISWETAYSVNALNKNKGIKFYFIQHYEIWDIWNNRECWCEVEKIEKDLTRQSLAIAEIAPKNNALRSIKKLVDETYKLPLEKIIISSWLKEILETRLRVNVAGIVTNGVNFETFHCASKSKNKIKRVLMSYRRGMPWKGGKDGIKALERVREEFPEVEFIMYGSKDRYVPQWIRFYENISDKELAELYCSSHIFVFPSWVEGFGLPPMEAASCRCAVVTTRVGGIPDYTVSGKTALISPPRDVETLANNIIYLLRNENELRSISDAGYNYIKQFTWENATEKLEEILERVCSSKKGSKAQSATRRAHSCMKPSQRFWPHVNSNG